MLPDAIPVMMHLMGVNIKQCELLLVTIPNVNPAANHLKESSADFFFHVSHINQFLKYIRKENQIRQNQNKLILFFISPHFLAGDPCEILRLC